MLINSLQIWYNNVCWEIVLNWNGIVSSIFLLSWIDFKKSLFGYNKNFLFQTTWISTIDILDSMMVRDVRMIPS